MKILLFPSSTSLGRRSISGQYHPMVVATLAWGSTWHQDPLFFPSIPSWRTGHPFPVAPGHESPLLFSNLSSKEHQTTSPPHPHHGSEKLGAFWHLEWEGADPETEQGQTMGRRGARRGEPGCCGYSDIICQLTILLVLGIYTFRIVTFTTVVTCSPSLRIKVLLQLELTPFGGMIPCLFVFLIFFC